MKQKQIKICKVEGCNRTTKALELCQLHYTRQWKTGKVGAVKPKQMKGNLIFNFGTNDAPGAVASNRKGRKSWLCPFYSVWYGMIQRCYSAKYHKQRPRAAQGTVCTKWKSFLVFKAWMEQQDWKGKELDKDLLVPGNRHYSPNTCCFIPQKLNNMFQQSQHTGVNYRPERPKPYAVRITMNGKEQHIGSFALKTEALAARNYARAAWIRKVAEKQTDPRIREGLIRQARELSHD